MDHEQHDAVHRCKQTLYLLLIVTPPSGDSTNWTFDPRAVYGDPDRKLEILNQLQPESCGPELKFRGYFLSNGEVSQGWRMRLFDNIRPDIEKFLVENVGLHPVFANQQTDDIRFLVLQGMDSHSLAQAETKRIAAQRGGMLITPQTTVIN